MFRAFTHRPKHAHTHTHMSILSQAVIKVRLCGTQLVWTCLSLALSFCQARLIFGVICLAACVFVWAVLFTCVHQQPEAPRPCPLVWAERVSSVLGRWRECIVRESVDVGDQGLCLLLFDLRLTECDPGSECRPGPAWVRSAQLWVTLGLFVYPPTSGLSCPDNQLNNVLRGDHKCDLATVFVCLGQTSMFYWECLTNT